MSWFTSMFRCPDPSGLLATLIQRIDAMSETLNVLVERVTEIETVADAAIELLHGLKAQLDEAIAGGDMAGVQELSDRLGAQSQELADAISANTVVDPDPPVDPEDPML